MPWYEDPVRKRGIPHFEVSHITLQPGVSGQAFKARFRTGATRGCCCRGTYRLAADLDERSVEYLNQLAESSS